MLLLAVVFLGGLPLAVVAIGLNLFSSSFVHCWPVLLRLAPYCLVFQVASLFLGSAITAISIVLGGVEPFLEPWTWYHVATVVASIVAIPFGGTEFMRQHPFRLSSTSGLLNTAWSGGAIADSGTIECRTAARG